MSHRSLAARADALPKQSPSLSSWERRSRVARALLLTALGVLVLLSVVPAHAGTKPTPAQKCFAAKRRAAGKKLDCKLGCTAKATLKALSVTSPPVAACLAACSTKFSDAFANAEQKGGCSTTGNAGAIEANIDAFLTTLVGQATYTQSEWGENCRILGLLQANYDTLYAGGLLMVGLPSPKFSVLFSSPVDLGNYLPATGPPGPLNASLFDPTSTSSGAFGGEVVALRLNVDFSDAGLLGGLATPFGSLTLCGRTADTDLNGMSVRQFLDVANTALGGGSTTDSISDLESLAQQLNASFAEGTPSTFAQDHLVDGCCGLTLCGSQCVDLTSDAANCGTCGKRCNVSASDCNFCSSGMCHPFNLQNDPSNCGTCGHVCLVTQVCSAGVCG